jgi:hypothetical protein
VARDSALGVPSVTNVTFEAFLSAKLADREVNQPQIERKPSPNLPLKKWERSASCKLPLTCKERPSPEGGTGDPPHPTGNVSESALSVNGSTVILGGYLRGSK